MAHSDASYRQLVYLFNSHQGLVRTRNEDAWGGQEVLDGYIFIVCDGMGGANSGELASCLAVESFLQKMVVSPFIKMAPSMRLEKVLSQTNKLIYKEGRKSKVNDGMGTTCVAMHIDWKGICTYAHVGDSRLYAFTDKEKLHNLTFDHSYVNELLRHGVVTAEEAKHHPKKNVLTRALGVSSTVEIDIGTVNIEEGIRALILATDGLHGMLDDEEIQSLVSNKIENGIESTVNELIALALGVGGRDNITVGMIAYN